MYIILIRHNYRFIFLFFIDTEQDKLLKQGHHHQRKAEEGYESKRKDENAAKETWRGICKINLCNSKDAVDMISSDFRQNLWRFLYETDVGV